MKSEILLDFYPIRALIVAARLKGESIPFCYQMAQRFACPKCKAPIGFACLIPAGIVGRVTHPGVRSFAESDITAMRNARKFIARRTLGYKYVNGVRDQIYQGWPLVAVHQSLNGPSLEIRQAFALMTPEELAVLDEMTRPEEGP